MASNTLQEVYDEIQRRAFSYAKGIVGPKALFSEMAPYERSYIDGALKAYGFLCPEGHRTLLHSELRAQPGRNYREALRWARRVEPWGFFKIGRVPPDVMAERLAA